MEFCAHTKIRLKNGDYQYFEIVFVLRPEHKTQEF